jgi:SAM-dependent methyltransferase
VELGLVMGKVQEWSDAAQTLAAVGAELALLESGAPQPPAEVVTALRGVTAAAGLAGLHELPAPQQAVALSMIRAFLHQAVDLIDDPARGPGWGYTDPAILDGWGRASRMVPTVIAQAHPDLAEVTRFLDVGTGVALLAIAATEVWPDATVVGLDTSSTSLARAKAHVDSAGRSDRIELREQALADLDDVDEFDLAWVPSFFLAERDLEVGLQAAVGSLRPGGWIVVGAERPVDDPLGAALVTLDRARNDGSALDAARVAALLERAGCGDVHVAPPMPVPLDFVLGRRR